ncbi:hypothetical protein [Microbacterium immunditiarum]|uniref:Uncharacterized protein n=1 Tax=Microbacterium immunditiarum TaxID=337480 RepID=A0A7Y9KL59_9MICO|nr:hypothetical protein [Microbacterium immunditiarum]NYE19913.1 hypothetical protein [Microbacterium immunditiarum]
MSPAPGDPVIEVADLRREYRLRGRKGVVTALDGNTKLSARENLEFWAARDGTIDIDT